MTTENTKIETTKADMFKIHLKDIVQIDEDNCRFISGEDVEELAQSILKYGQDTPVHVKRLPNNAGFKLISGNRRVKAIRKINDELPEDQHIPVKAIIVRQNDHEMILSNIRENVDRKEYTPMDQATAAHRLIEKLGYTQAQAAAELHVTPAWISQILNLLDLNYDVQVQVHRGTISVSDAIEMAKTMDSDDQREIVAAINTAEQETKALAEAMAGPVPAEVAPKVKAKQEAEVKKAGKEAGKKAISKKKGYTVPASKKNVVIPDLGKRNTADMRELLEELMDPNLYSTAVRTVSRVLLDAWDGKIREDAEVKSLLVGTIDGDKKSAGSGG